MGFLYTRMFSKDGSSYRIALPAWVAKEWAADGVRKVDVEYDAAADRFVVIPVRPGGGKK